MAAGLSFFLLISSLFLQFSSPSETLNDALDHLLLDLPASLDDDESWDDVTLPAFKVKGFSCAAGNLTGLSSIYRTGECTLSVVSDSLLELNLNVGFKNLTLHFPTCAEFSSLTTSFLVATYQNNVNIKVQLVQDDDETSCYPNVTNVKISPYSSIHSSSFDISFGSGFVRKTESFLVKTLLRLFKFPIELVINRLAVTQAQKISSVDICNYISES